MLRIGGIVMLSVMTLIGPALICWGSFKVITQTQKLKQAQPVDAIVLSTEIEVTRAAGVGLGDSGDEIYKPIVHYVYSIAGDKYQSSNIWVYKKGEKNRDWALNVISQFRAGQPIIAYYFPCKPSDAFLLKEQVFAGGYDLILAGVPIFVLLFLLDLLMYISDRSYMPVKCDDKWCRLTGRMRISSRYTASLLLCLFWNSITVLTFVHYFITASPPYERWGWILLFVYASVGIVIIGVCFYYKRILTNVKDAEIMANSGYFELGDTVVLRVFQQVLTRIKECHISLTCTKKTKLNDEIGRAHV